MKKITPVTEELNINLTYDATHVTNLSTNKKEMIIKDLKKQTELSWSARIPEYQGKLEQDDYEGVDESEWE